MGRVQKPSILSIIYLFISDLFSVNVNELIVNIIGP